MKNKILVAIILAIIPVSCTPVSAPSPIPTSIKAIVPKDALILTPTLLLSTPAEYPVPKTYYSMDNTHVVAVRPGGKELYVYSYESSDMVLVVDVDFPADSVNTSRPMFIIGSATY